MNYLVVDVESTTKNKGHPFTPSNKLCMVGVGEDTYKIQYDDEPFGRHLAAIQERLRGDGVVVVGFNLKFDLHWLRRYGIRLGDTQAVWDCQLAYFLETHQQVRYPSMNEAAAHYGVGAKLTTVDDEYWSRGLDTTDVPCDTLTEYLLQDLVLTSRIQAAQQKWMEQNPKIYHLFKLQCKDLRVLQEMEWNGIQFNKEESLKRADEVDGQISELTTKLTELVGCRAVNWNSPEHVSAVLYGGVVKEDIQEDYLFTYANPRKEPVWKKRWIIKEHTLPRLVNPLPNSSLQKEGVYKTGESVVKELASSRTTGREAKAIISLLLQLAELSKLNDYYRGIPTLIEEMEWENNILHGNLNQCNVITGRLSSNKPNLQNMPPEVHELLVSRYEA